MDIIKSIVVWFTGILFLVITFPLTFIVWILSFPFDRDRKITHMVLVYQSLLLSHLIPIWKIRISGREKAVRGTTYVIISNHQSILDIILLNCLRYRYKWVSKIENIKVPVIGWYLKMADYITVDRGNDESKTEMLERSLIELKRGNSIMIFPEGTRSSDSQIGFFKRGAFQLALEANIPVLPVLIDGTGGILPKHGYRFGYGYHIQIKVLDPVFPSAFGTAGPEDLALKFSSMMGTELTKLRSEQV
jgi:1-acyl-sn-glycerol-3-phosphate acyltransferase